MAAQRKLQVPLPDRFWVAAGQQPPLKWNQWYQQLEDFFELTDSGLPAENKLSNVEKNRYLRSLLGAEGVRQFSAHPDADKVTTSSFADYSAAAKSVFGRSANPVRAHYDFNMRKQGAHETVQEYILALRSLAADCDFHGQEAHHLAVQFATGIYSKDSQQRLLSQKTIDLDEFQRIAEADESSAQDASRMRNEAVVAAARFHGKPKGSKSGGTGIHPAQNFGGAKGKGLVCSFGCGGSGHKYKDPACPAFNKTCRNCNGLHHFDKVCRKPKGQNIHSIKLDIDLGVKGVEAPLPADGIQRPDPFRCDITLTTEDGLFATVTGEADSCSDISGITYTLYEQHFGSVPLTPVANAVRNFDGTEISAIRGTFVTTGQFGGREAKLRIYVFPDSYGTVFGKDIIYGLKLILDGESMAVHVKATRQNAPSSKYADLLAKYPSLTKDSLGCFPDYEHRIEVASEALPRIQKSRPIPLYRRDEAMRQIKHMEKTGVWSKVQRSDWVLPLVTADKPDGGVRITTDCSYLNQYVVPFRFPLPFIKDTFLALRQSKYFTKLDFTKAFYHIKLHPDSRKYTTTDTPLGLFAYNRLTMGLTDAASVFAYAIHMTFSDIPRNVAFQDDELIHAETVEQHDAALDQVLQRASEKDFRLNLAKCNFCTEEVTFLGHRISKGTLRPDPRNLGPIRDFPAPTTVKGVQRFLGMVNHYADHIPGLATLAEPLRALTRKDTPFSWSVECQNAFAALKDRACDGLELFIFDPEAPTILTTDASDVGIGGVLSQIQNGKEVPVAFGHHTLDTSQRNYAAYEREAYAVLYFCEHWAKLLLGRQFTLRTDHQSLDSLLSRGHKRRQALKFDRWRERLEPFSYTVQYTKGRDNVVADALSRVDEDPGQKPAYIRAITAAGLSVRGLAEAISEDDLLRKVRSYIETSKWPPKSQMDNETAKFHRLRREFRVVDECILRNGCQFLVPGALRKQLLQRAHKGHPGIVRMKRKLRDTYWWPGLDNDIEIHVRYCMACQDSAKSMPKYKIPPGHLPAPKAPWERVGIDISGPFETAPHSKRYIVALVDHFSKYPHTLSTGDITSQRIITWLKELFSTYGNPSRLLSDNGPQFTSHEFAEFLRDRDIQQDLTPFYHPQGNGAVEVFNRYLKHGIQTFGTGQLTWDEGLRDLLTHFRATAADAGGKSPSELFLGRPMRLDYEVNRNRSHITPPLAGSEVPQSGRGEREAPTHLQFRGPFQVGDRVRSRLPHVPKGRSPFSEAKTVTQVLGNWTYRLNDGSVWNARKLRRVLEAPVQALETGDFIKEPPRRSRRPNKGVPAPKYGVYD